MKLLRIYHQFSLTQKIALGLIVSISLVFFGAAYTISVIKHLPIQIKGLKPRSFSTDYTVFTAKLSVRNKTIIPISISSIDLQILNNQNAMLAFVQRQKNPPHKYSVADTPIRLGALSTVVIPVQITTVRDLGIEEIVFTLAGLKISGSVQIVIWGYELPIPIRREYAMLKL